MSANFDLNELMCRLTNAEAKIAAQANELHKAHEAFGKMKNHLSESDQRVTDVLSGSSTPPIQINPPISVANSTAPSAKDKVKITDVAVCSAETKTKAMNWINQLSLFFIEHHEHNTGHYQKDSEKIMYAMHHSDGSVAKWLKPYMFGQKQFASYDEFHTTYLRLFGPASKSLDATAIVKKLCKNCNLPTVKLATSIDKVHFTLDYNEPALKDLFHDCSKPETVAAMVGNPKVPTAYADFIEYCIEVESELYHAEGECCKPPPKHHQKFSPPSNPTLPASNLPIRNAPVLMDIDATTGKLKQSTCEHHVKNNLCLYCGAEGHKASDCPILAEHQKSGKGQAHQ